MKKKVKTVIIVVILLLVGVLAAVGVRTARTYLSGASGGKEPQNVRVEADVKSATVTWQTDNEVQGTVEYGTTPASLLLRALENQPSTTHRVVLSPLKEATTYYFRVRVGDEVFDNNGIPYSFKTKQGEGTAGETQPVEPTQSAERPTQPDESPTQSAERPTQPDEPTATEAVEPTTTVEPTEVPDETSESTESATKVTSCDKSEFKEKFGTSDSEYDFDDNGVVNSRDWIQCLNQNK